MLNEEARANEIDRQNRKERLNRQKVDIPSDMTDHKAIRALVDAAPNDGYRAVDIFACGHFYVLPQGARCGTEVHTAVCEACSDAE